MTLYITRGFRDGNPVSLWFSQIRKAPTNIEGGGMSVTMTSHGLKLLYDAQSVIDMSDEQIDYKLSHELMHILNMHFLRAEQLMMEYGVPKSQFEGQLASLADLPTNHSLQDLPAYPVMKDELMTYEKTDLTYDQYPTFEQIARLLYVPPPPSDKEGSRGTGGEGTGDNNSEGSPGSDSTVVKVYEDGSTEVIQEGSGPTVTIPQIDVPSMEDMTNEVQRINNHVSDTMDKNTGTISQALLDAFSLFEEMNRKKEISAWEMLKRYLTEYRSIDKQSKRSMRRLSRRSMIPPGRVKAEGFSAMVIVDESGSMSDEEVHMAVRFAMRCIKYDNHDKMWYAHWDTKLIGDIEDLKSEQDVKDIKRRACGGTVFTNVFKDEAIREKDVDLYILVSDGELYGDWPEAVPGMPTIWILTTKNGYENWKQEGCGVAVCVDE